MTDFNAADWAEQDANNSSPQPNGVQGGYAPSAIAPIIRAIRGAIKRDFVQRNPIYTTTGTGAAYVLTFTQGPTAYYKGFTLRIWIHANNTGACSLNVNSLGAKSILSTHGEALSAGQLRIGRVVQVVYNGTNFELFDVTAHDPKFTGTLTANSANIVSLTSNTVTVNETITANRLRLLATNDASANSTLHALQIGADNGQNLTIDGNEILVRTNGVGNTLYVEFGVNTLAGVTKNDVEYWHATNDGASSGLDADLLDGQHGAYYRDLTNSTGTLPNARLVGDYSFANLTLSGGLTAYTIDSPNRQQVIINAGESGDFATGQTTEQVFINAETGLVVTTSPDNWASLWAGRKTTTITGTSIVIDGDTVWHAGNDGAGSGLDADLLDGQHGTYYRDLTNSTGTLPNARLAGSYTGIVGTGALNAGSITSGFGNINIGTAIFTGNGSGLTTLNASNLSAGTLPNARLSGDYSFANLTLSGGINVSAAGGINCKRVGHPT